MSKIDFSKLYSQIGWVLCGGAGAIVGYITGGTYLAILGVIVGLASGYLLEKKVARENSEEETL